MLNLAEILTILIGCLLALVFIDGVRRAIRIRNSKLKVDLISSEKIDLDFEEEWKGYEEQSEVITDEEELGESYISPSSTLNIIHLHDQSSQVFSESTLSQALVFYNFIYEENGIFSILDSDNNLSFKILNGKNPGTFLNASTNDIALVLDSKNQTNPLEAFDLFIEVSMSLQETFQCNLLDEDRNLMTKQMIEHMKNEFHENQRQFLASAS
ncbi:MAG: cell division protein ZipA C-terminal FtsZ-binding domain-containing protein [Pseudomonadota bacterium]|nr:cell division protein ZipA C-terminal FtsZ-binding domain-containing protein [Pseudomonadota bacterium]